MKLFLIFLTVLALSTFVDSRPQDLVDTEDKGEVAEVSQKDGSVAPTTTEEVVTSEPGGSEESTASFTSFSTESTEDDAPTGSGAPSAPTTETAESTTEEKKSSTTDKTEMTSMATGEPTKGSTEKPQPATSAATGEPSTTEQPHPAPPAPKTGSFNGWSFFGGILLTVGIMTVSFVGLKFYKARNGGASLNYNRAPHDI